MSFPVSSLRPAPDGRLPAPCEPRLRAHGWAGLAGSICTGACVRACTWGTDLGDDEFEGRFKFLHVGCQSAHQLPCLFSIKESDVLSGGGTRRQQMGERATSPQNEAPSPDTGQDPWGPRPPRARPLQLAVPEQVAEEGPSHVHGHALANAGQQHQVPEGQQALGERRGSQGRPGGLLSLRPGPPSCCTWRP